ncbi:MAG: serine/threonine-protein kinase [Candidatus Omnitrophota bacterium]
MKKMPRGVPNEMLETKRFNGILYKKGDFIGEKYEVYELLGIGGMGIVYLVYAHDCKDISALKTFKDEYLFSPDIREDFKKEALIWVNLGRHPYIVSAKWVWEHGGRLYVAMEYIPKRDNGCVSLHEHIVNSHGSLPLQQVLKWAIQFCYGMEHAYCHGIRSHRDIKPRNLLITPYGELKVSDFGLAVSLAGGEYKKRQWVGTPGYLSPEQAQDATQTDIRSDIYSFGLVLWQMVIGNENPPFFGARWEGDTDRFIADIRLGQLQKSLPKVESPLWPIIYRCVQPEPGNRYQNIEVLRKDLQALLRSETGEEIKMPTPEEIDARDLSEKGVSLAVLGQYDEAVAYHEKAILLEPSLSAAWHNKGAAHARAGKYSEAMASLEKALSLNEGHAPSWNLLSFCYNRLSNWEESLKAAERALSIVEYASALCHKGIALFNLNREEEALLCFQKALKLDPNNVETLCSTARCYLETGKFGNAIHSYGKALELDSGNATAWYSLGYMLHSLKHKLWLERLRQTFTADKNDSTEKLDITAEYWPKILSHLMNKDLDAVALFCVEKSLALRPHDKDALSLKSVILKQG